MFTATYIFYEYWVGINFFKMLLLNGTFSNLKPFSWTHIHSTQPSVLNYDLTYRLI